MSDDLQAFRERAARAVAKVARGSAADNADRYIRMADAVIAEFEKPTDAMIDAAYEAVRFDEAWAINSRRDFVKAVKAMVRHALGKDIPAYYRYIARHWNIADQDGGGPVGWRVTGVRLEQHGERVDRRTHHGFVEPADTAPGTERTLSLVPSRCRHHA